MPKQLLCCVCFECNSEGLTFEVESFFDRDVKAAKCIGCKGKDKLIIKGCFLTRHDCYECAIVQKQLEAASEQTEDEAIEQQKNGIKEKRKVIFKTIIQIMIIFQTTRLSKQTTTILSL